MKLLNSKSAEYLLIGGYAVNYYGYARSTGDMDIWIAISKINASKVVAVLREFGFGVAELQADLFLRNDQIVRLGEEPLRIELLTSISGVRFADCYARRNRVRMDGLRVNLISLHDLKRNKAATGRAKDQADLEQLERLEHDS